MIFHNCGSPTYLPYWATLISAPEFKCLCVAPKPTFDVLPFYVDLLQLSVYQFHQIISSLVVSVGQITAKKVLRWLVAFESLWHTWSWPISGAHDSEFCGPCLLLCRPIIQVMPWYLPGTGCTWCFDFLTSVRPVMAAWSEATPKSRMCETTCGKQLAATLRACVYQLL